MIAIQIRGLFEYFRGLSENIWIAIIRRDPNEGVI